MVYMTATAGSSRALAASAGRPFGAGRRSPRRGRAWRLRGAAPTALAAVIAAAAVAAAAAWGMSTAFLPSPSIARLDRLGRPVGSLVADDMRHQAASGGLGLGMVTGALPAQAQDSLILGEVLKEPVLGDLESTEEAIVKTTSSLADAVTSGDVVMSGNVILDAVAEANDRFWMKVDAGDTPWDEVGAVFFSFVVLVNVAAIAWPILEGALAGPTQEEQNLEDISAQKLYAQAKRARLRAAAAAEEAEDEDVLSLPPKKPDGAKASKSSEP
mmetsp:Transcript_57488/g.124298  ORF Transcript_57488/g.124298 Transcript_57488/m.124298 type:complete len:271 (+) Transcript_57488:55-867(+)